ncbi:MAG: peptide-methionine (S)-S-oxide reductase MsrA, partial [Candidatus Thermoplasmatota archaeon]|nr:peptide-methionine (S)-S-oxide reductase MsrA [Candidatus Thermoplasmatota archaeon]
TYEQVCSKTTGHAEVVQLTYDPDEVTYRELLEVFFTVHDPTTPNRQGADVGTQYRSIILTHNDAQAKIAQDVIAWLEDEGIWDGIVTEVEPLETFYEAEPYHQGYYAKNPEQGYCQAVIRPKLKKLRERWADKLAS